MEQKERPLVEELVDLAIYAPLGLMLTIIEDLPEVVERGRRFLGPQVSMAKMMGRFAYGQARRQFEAQRRPVTPARRPSEQAAPARARVPVPADEEPGPDALGIADYDTLAASQVVGLLGRLRPEQLAAVRAYEESHRKRQTILHRITQLEHGGRHD